MFKAEDRVLSPSQESNQSGSHSLPGQKVSEQMQFSIGSMHSKSLVEEHQVGSKIVENEHQDKITLVSGAIVHENGQPSFGDVTRNSVTRLSSKDTNENSQASNPRQDISENMLEFNSQCAGIGSSELKQQLAFQIVEDEPETAASHIINEKSLPFSEGLTKNDFPEDLQSAPGQHNSDCIRNGPLKLKQNLDLQILQSESKGTCAAVSSHLFEENSQPSSDDMAEVRPDGHLQPYIEDVSKISQTDKILCQQRIPLEQPLDTGFEIAGFKPSVVKDKLGVDFMQNESQCTSSGKLVPPPGLVIENSLIKNSGLREIVSGIPNSGQSGRPPGDIGSHEQLESQAKKVKNPKHLGFKDKRSPIFLKKKYMLRSSGDSARVLRSRSREKPKEAEVSSSLAGVSSEPSGREKKKRKESKKTANRIDDEYSKIRRHFRYLLNRINYEQSLISAYSTEGWKGLSLEKLKPEKELQRATSEILRRKLKIRDLFQHLDSLFAQGSFPETLFDSEGQISSEDIFCAKCGSKELSADNDIILCDGACDRGFHLFCLEPPLLKEDIPPDDEGWLCPGCDCKDDCIYLLNESLGTDLSITDNWEKIFPEAAAAAGNNRDPHFGLPSDDSDDDDYDPDGPETIEKDQLDESSFDESDFSYTSEDLEAPPKDEQYMGLPSDDSGDEDYDPDAPCLDKKVEQESSSSDFTSDSEDLGLAVEENESSVKDKELTFISLPGDFSGRRSKHHGTKKHSLNDELLSISEKNSAQEDSAQDDSATVPEKRSIEKLDYKKLYDETYGNVPSSSSDDEDWSDAAAPSPRKSTSEVAPITNGNATVVESSKRTKSHKKNTNKDTPNRRARQESKFEKGNDSSVASPEGSSKSASDKKASSSAYKRLGEDVTKRLYKSFKENQYPDRATKESLARELEITFRQVSKWFENTRWNFNHPSPVNATAAKAVSKKDIPLPQARNIKSQELGPETVTMFSVSSGSQNAKSPQVVTDGHSKNVKGTMSTPGSNGKKLATPTSRKRKTNGKSGEQASNLETRTEKTRKLSDPLKSQEKPTSQGIQTRSRKSHI